MNKPVPCGYCQFQDGGVMCRAPLPPGYLVCADCYDRMREYNPHPEAIDVTPEPSRWPLGRWVPPVIFTVFVVVTYMASFRMAFWMLFLMPVMALGWIFGFGPGHEVEHYEADLHPQVGTDWLPDNSPWND